MIWLTSCHYSKSKEIIWITSNKNLKGSLEISFLSVLQKHSNCKRAIGSMTDFKNYYVTRTYQTSLTTKLGLGFSLYKLFSHRVTRRLHNDLKFLVYTFKKITNAREDHCEPDMRFMKLRRHFGPERYSAN